MQLFSMEDTSSMGEEVSAGAGKKLNVLIRSSGGDTDTVHYGTTPSQWGPVNHSTDSDS